MASGWSNYPGMVTSHKMKETEMGYRGSKSNILNDLFYFTVAVVLVIVSWVIDKLTYHQLIFKYL